MPSNELTLNPLIRMEELADLNSDAWETLRNVHSVDFGSLSEATADFGVQLSQDILSNIGAKIENDPVLYATDFMLAVISHLRDQVRDSISQQRYSQQPAADSPNSALPQPEDTLDIPVIPAPLSESEPQVTTVQRRRIPARPRYQVYSHSSQTYDASL